MGAGKALEELDILRQVCSPAVMPAYWTKALGEVCCSARRRACRCSSPRRRDALRQAATWTG